MLGRVIDGLYNGCELHKLPDKNVLYIVTEDGKRIALNKNNAISIEDVTAAYSSNGKKTLMVMWNNFETSIIQLGLPAKQSSVDEKVAKDETKSTSHSIPNKRQHKEEQKVKRNEKKIPLIWIGSLIFILCIASAVLLFGLFGRDRDVNTVENTIQTTKEADPLEEYKEIAETSLRNHLSKATASASGVNFSGISADDILDSFTVVSYENENIDGINYTFDVRFRYTVAHTHYYFVAQVTGTIGKKEDTHIEFIDEYTEDSEADEAVTAPPVKTISNSEREEIAEAEAVLKLMNKLNTDTNYRFYDADLSRYSIGSIEQNGDIFTVYGKVYLYNKHGSLEDIREFTATVKVDSTGYTLSSTIRIDN